VHDYYGHFAEKKLPASYDEQSTTQRYWHDYDDATRGWVSLRSIHSTVSAIVMPGLDPGIHPSEEFLAKEMDCRVKPGNNGILP
jgi:hypothetical protein